MSRKLLFSCYVVIAAALAVGACRTVQPDSAAEESAPYKIIAYLYARGSDLSWMDPTKLTHVNYSFALVNPEGEMYFRREQAAEHLAQLRAFKAVNLDLKILVSVGGWGADNFSDAALTDASRQKFARSAVDLLKAYELDGIDLDWEYPGQTGPGIKYRPEDKQNFTLMLKAVREHLDALSDERGLTGDDRYLLTIASTDGQYFEHTEMDKLHVYLDWINIMTYDFVGGGYSRETGHHTALYPSGEEGASNSSAEISVNQHLAAGIPARKLVIGSGFYGKGFRGVRSERNGLNQPFSGGAYAGSLSYSRLASEYVGRNGFVRYWDDAAKAPYLWNADSTIFITYDDPESLKHKAEFVKRLGLGGVMFWEYSHDPDEVLLDALYENLR